MFVFSVVPFAIEVGASGISSNYFYILIFLLPFTQLRQSRGGLMLLTVYTVVLLAGIFQFFTHDFYYFIRSFASYLVFIFPLLFAFVRLEDVHFKTFKQAVILVSLSYSLLSIYQLATLGYAGDFFMMKNEIGSQRFGFVIILAFFLVLYEEDYLQLKRLTYLAILGIGIILTFSRSTLVGFGAAFFVLLILDFRRIKVKYILLGFLFGIAMLVVFKDTVIGEIADFFAQYTANTKTYDLSNKSSSEGYRIYVLKQVLAYIKSHPLFGSSYAGLYLLYDEYSATGASAHSQYNDVLLRTGLIGFSLYLFVLYRMTRFYARYNRGVFYGLIGIIVYGFFHETFKLGHGSFLFAFLLGYYLNKTEIRSRQAQEETGSTAIAT